MHLLVVSDRPDAGTSLLPALELLDHTVAVAPQRLEGISATGDVDVLVVDATAELGAASRVCRASAATASGLALLLVVAESGLAVLKTAWGFHDWVLPTAGPAEVETRLRLVVDRCRAEAGRRTSDVGHLSIDEDTYVVRLRGRPLDLTFKEFELLRYLVSQPGRVFSRSQLLQAVWGYDYYGGSRTVDVHIRRLRAKLGAEYEQLIGTVRGVGYKLDPEASPGEETASEPA